VLLRWTELVLKGATLKLLAVLSEDFLLVEEPDGRGCFVGRLQMVAQRWHGQGVVVLIDFAVLLLLEVPRDCWG
jgi:hypothetical protein